MLEEGEQIAAASWQLGMLYTAKPHCQQKQQYETNKTLPIDATLSSVRLHVDERIVDFLIRYDA